MKKPLINPFLCMLLAALVGAGAMSFVPETAYAAVSRTGSVTNVVRTTNTGTSNISIPADAEVLVVAVGGYQNTANYFSGGTLKLNNTAMNVARDGDNSTTFHMGMVYYYNVQSIAGSSSVALVNDWSGASNPISGVNLTYAFYKGTLTSSPIGAAGGVQANTGSLTTGSLTASSGDLIVAVTAYTSNVTSITWTGVTNVLTSDNSGSRLSYAEVSPSGATTASITLNNGDPDGSIVGIVLAQAQTPNYTESSMRTLGATLSAQGSSSGVQNGGLLSVNGQSMGYFDYVVVSGNTTIASGWTVSDYFSSAKNKGAIVVINGNLTINSSETFTPSFRKLYTYIYVTGSLSVAGGISMTARGGDHSISTGSSTTAVPILIAGGTYSSVTNPTVPAGGGGGGAGGDGNGTGIGVAGSSGSSGGSGGGGGGGVFGTGATTGGNGAAGTSFSGGTGGGGHAANANGAGNDGADNGGPGGDAVSSFHTSAGGSGNPGGAGLDGGPAGGDGTGGTLIAIILGALSGSGTISANGVASGLVDAAGGGASGGGSVTVLYGSDSSSITPTATGGAAGVSNFGTPGGSGGDGTARKLQIPASSVSPSRTFRLFEGFILKIFRGTLIINQTP